MSRIVISIFDDVRNPHYGGGGAIVVDQVAERLSRTHSVTVLSGSFRGHQRATSELGYTKRYLRVGWAGPRAAQILYQLALPVYARFLRYDVWIESFTPPFSTSLVPLAAGGRAVVGLVQMLAAEDSTARYRLPFARVERRGLRLYRYFLVLNAQDQDLIEVANPGAHCTLVHNGVQLPPAPTTFGSGAYVLFLGRIDVRQKGLDLMIAAYAISGATLPLVIAGSGSPREQRRLQRLLAQTDLPVAYVGHVSGAAKDVLIQDSAFMVLPSRYETFGLSALEAMSYGKPVVHFDLPRLGWIPAEAGLSVAAFDVAALAEGIATFTNDATARELAGRAARAAADEYAWSTVGAEFVAALDEIVDRHEGSTPQLPTP